MCFNIIKNNPDESITTQLAEQKVRKSDETAKRKASVKANSNEKIKSFNNLENKEGRAGAPDAAAAAQESAPAGGTAEEAASSTVAAPAAVEPTPEERAALPLQYDDDKSGGTLPDTNNEDKILEMILKVAHQDNPFEKLCLLDTEINKIINNDRLEYPKIADAINRILFEGSSILKIEKHNENSKKTISITF